MQDNLTLLIAYWQPFNHWVEALAVFLGGLGELLALVAGALAVFSFFQPKKRATLLALLHEPEKWGQLATELRLLPGVKTDKSATETAKTSYVNNLRRLRHCVNRFYGNRLLSRHAFNRCLTLAFAYPILAALLTWAATGQPEIGGLRLAQDEVADWQRWATVAFVLAYVYFTITLFNKSSQTRMRLGGVLTRAKRWLDQRAGFLAKAARWSLSNEGFVVLAVVLAVAFAFTVAVAFAVAVAVDFAVVLAFAFTVAFAFAFGVAYAFAFAGILAVFLAVVGYIEQAALLAFFFLLLPLLNALADMISVAATRKFLNLMAQSSERGWNFAFEILSDFLIALLCLFALVWSLTQALELWQHIHPASLPFDWRAYRGQIIPDTQTGGMLYLMVLTTLLPTLLHVGLGAWGMAIYRGQMIGDALSKLKTLELDPDFRALLPMEKSTLTAPVATLIRRAYRKGWWWALTCVAGTLALFLAGIWGGTALLQSLGVSPFAL